MTSSISLSTGLRSRQVRHPRRLEFFEIVGAGLSNHINTALEYGTRSSYAAVKDFIDGHDFNTVFTKLLLFDASVVAQF